jgi:hypothetical protein
MPYVNVTGTNANNFMLYQGIAGFYNQTLINPYTGYTITITGTKNINNGIYDGLGGTDTLSMTPLGDVLSLVDSMGTIMVKNIEMLNANSDGDVILMSHATVTYGNVTIRGGLGDDLLWSNNGNDLILGADGNDIIDGGGGDDFILGGFDDDYLSGWTGTDTLLGGDGSDIFAYSTDSIWGSTALASLGSSIPFAADVNLNGKNRSHDTFHGDANDSLVVVGTGTDTLILTSGDDVLVASDTLSPTNGLTTPRVSYIDIVEAGDGNDVVDFSGVSSVDITINGGNGDDILGGSDGTDTLNGDADNDRLFGAEGNDTLSGGTGDDSYFYNLGDGNDTIVETSGTDSITFGAGIAFSDLTLTVSGSDLLVTVGGQTITIENHFAADLSGRVESLVFDDNSTFDLASYGIDPVANDDVFAGDEDTIISGNVLDNDVAGTGDTLTVTPATITTSNGGTVTLNADGSFSYQGAANFYGTDGFSYTVNDGNGGSATADVTLDVGMVNDDPVAGDDAASGNEDEIIAGTLLDNDTDVDGDTLTAVAETITTANGGSVTINADGTFSYQGAADFNGLDSFDYTVTDGNGGTDIGTVSLTVGAVNDDPVADDDDFSGNEDELITGTLLDNDTDVDGDILSTVPETITTANGGTVIINADGTFSYQGAANFNGSDTFDYTVTDGNGGTDTATVSLNIDAVNDDPVAFDDAASGDEDEIITGTLLDNDTDVDGDILSAVAETITTANGGSVTINADGTFSYQGAADFNGSDSFDYTVTDGNGGTDIGTVSLTVGAVNDDPVAFDDTASGDEDELITGTLLGNDTDVDGDILSAVAETITTANGGSVIINADGTFSYQGAANFNGSDSFDYTVTDGNGGTDIGTVSLNVGAVNDDPVAMDDDFTGNEDEVITGNLLDNDSDVDGDTLSVDAQTLTTANGGSVTINADGTFSYQGAANFNGTDSFTYTARDSSGASDVANVTIGVAAVNDAPIPQADHFNGLRNVDITGNVLADNGAGPDYDVDGDTLSVQPGTFMTDMGGSVELNADGSFTYTPEGDFYGADSFQYTLLDGNGGTATWTVTLSVNLDPSESIIGTDDGETIDGTPADDEIFALGGDDTVRGQGGDDTVYGGEGNDILYGDDGILSSTTQDKVFEDDIVMPHLKEGVNINNLRPSGDPARGINEGNLTVDYDATAGITFRKGYAGYDNSFGSFGIAADGTIVSTSMEWANVKTAGINVTHQIDIPVGPDGGAYGFFLVANGNNTNNGYTGLNVTGDGTLSFVYNYGKPGQRAANINDPGSKISLVYNDGVTTKVLKGDVYFTTERGDPATINKDGKTHVVSGLLDSNDVTLNPKAADLSSKPVSFTKNGMTVSALTGTLIGSGDKIGIKSSASGGNIISGNEALHVAFANGAEKMTISLSDIAGCGTGIDFKIYLNGSTTPISYEHVISGSVSGGLIDIVLDASDFGPGVITAITISSVSNSSSGTESFWLDNVQAEIPGGTDTNTLRIGFEDLYNMGDADYEDVLFDLDINPITTGDVEGGNDYLDGGAGNDILYGEGGDDILIIGDGADQAHGGEGADIFALTMVDASVDTIHDFDASEGDVINITDVLESYDPLSDDIADFVRLVQIGADSQLQINADGQGSFVAAALIIGGTDADIATMISNGSLVADQSALA